MNPEPDGRPPLSPELRRAEFAGRLEFTYSEFHDAWVERIGPVQASQKPFLIDQLDKRIGQGQVERKATRDGYRILAVAIVPSGYEDEDDDTGDDGDG
jgi:hypothetical protein